IHIRIVRPQGPGLRPQGWARAQAWALRPARAYHRGRTMKRGIRIGLAIAMVSGAVFAQARPETRGPEQARKMLDTYCVGCHNSRVRTAGIAFDTVTLTSVHDNADAWEKALRKMRGRQMPPPGSRQPDQSEIDAFTSWMEQALA